MSGFDKDWLSLREPVDQAARAPDLLTTLASVLSATKDRSTILDIGCGTGSTYRSLSPHLPQVSWQLLDYDAALLAEAQRRITGDSVSFRRHDLNDLQGLDLDGVVVVTASAFFDLCSEAFCKRFVDHLADRKVGLYAALNFDGRISFAPPLPLDAAVVEDFNHHQQTDKGLGPALGPQATDCLERLFHERGYQVLTAASPWQMGEGQADLHRAFVEGMVAPVVEMGKLEPQAVDAWRRQRLAEIGQGGRCEVGHFDLLALPPT